MATSEIEGKPVKTVTLVFTIDADVDVKLFQEAITKLIHEGDEALNGPEMDSITAVWNLERKEG